MHLFAGTFRRPGSAFAMMIWVKGFGSRLKAAFVENLCSPFADTFACGCVYMFQESMKL
jgi:hypothetical protein